MGHSKSIVTGHLFQGKINYHKASIFQSIGDEEFCSFCKFELARVYKSMYSNVNTIDYNSKVRTGITYVVFLCVQTSELGLTQIEADRGIRCERLQSGMTRV